MTWPLMMCLRCDEYDETHLERQSCNVDGPQLVSWDLARCKCTDPLKRHLFRPRDLPRAWNDCPDRFTWIYAFLVIFYTLWLLTVHYKVRSQPKDSQFGGPDTGVRCMPRQAVHLLHHSSVAMHRIVRPCTRSNCVLQPSLDASREHLMVTLDVVTSAEVHEAPPGVPGDLPGGQGCLEAPDQLQPRHWGRGGRRGVQGLRPALLAPVQHLHALPGAPVLRNCTLLPYQDKGCTLAVIRMRWGIAGFSVSVQTPAPSADRHPSPGPQR